MDTNTVVVVVVVLFALVVVAGFAAYRRRGSAKVKAGPLELEFEGDEAPGVGDGAKVKMTDVTAGRSVKADDQTGGGVAMERVEARSGDVKVVVSGADADPKVLPPA